MGSMPEVRRVGAGTKKGGYLFQDSLALTMLSADYFLE